MAQRFGDSYYGRKEGSGHSSANAEHIKTLLSHYHGGLKERVQRSVDQWNLTIREHLRSETALKLVWNSNEKQQRRENGFGHSFSHKPKGKPRQTKRLTVPIKVEDGLPLPLDRLYSDEERRFIWELLLNKKCLEETQKGLGFLKDKNPQIVNFLKELERKASPQSIGSVYRYNENILKEIEKFKFQEKLKNIDEDILGAYFFLIPEVHIYWMAIGIFASSFGISVEGLTFVALTHELAHAYTHLGNDIDGDNWNTEAFRHSDSLIVEGLGQFYTLQICKKIKSKFPLASEAFHQLCKIQSETYLDFQNWFGGKKRASEPVRFSMLMARKNNITDYNEFRNVLEKTASEIRKKKN